MDAALCPKGFAGIQTLYDPYRIVKVLKRAGKRGENKWISIPFDQAIKEVVFGGNLFGEGHVEGIADLAALRDPAVHKALAEDAKNVAAKKMTLEEFQAKHADNLKYLIDPQHPDLGPKNNQICYYWGRQKGGRGEFISRFFRDGLGTTNTHGHTTVCQGSLYFTCKAMSDQFVEGKFTDGSKFYWQADTGNAEFLLFVGASPYEANYGPPMRAGKITQGMVDKGRKIAVVDPRCSKTAGRAWKWLPVAPEAVGALGQAHDPLDHRKRTLRCPLSGQCQQSRSQGQRRAHLDAGLLAGTHERRRDSWPVPAGFGPGPPQRDTAIEQTPWADVGVRRLRHPSRL
jgi:anaerobic selenocysteine-containing dehydrogenase